MYSSIALLLGHLTGDFLFQGHKMALTKSKSGYYGFLWCIWHCCVYSTCVALFVIMDGWRTNFVPNNIDCSFGIAWLIAFLTHFPIDRHSLAWPWMRMIGQSQFTNDLKDKRNYFVGSIYIYVDNTMHLILMWLLFSWFGGK